MKKLILEISNDAYYFRTAEYVILDLNELEIEAIKNCPARSREVESPKRHFPIRAVRQMRIMLPGM